MTDNIYLFLGGPLHGSARALEHDNPDYFVYELVPPDFGLWWKGDGKTTSYTKVLRYEKVRIRIGRATLHAYVLAGDSIEDRLVEHIMKSVKGNEK